jgi:hypothetical protein
MLLADRYDDRTHFIYELLQNAEDALRRRKGWDGSRAVRFSLMADELRLSHFGEPFGERDVRGICGIAQSTKEATAIGRFGIGFKSVYAYTPRPEVHSGNESFSIEKFVWPSQVPAIERNPDETIILLPLDPSAAAEDRLEIATGLQDLGPGALLFLREIEEIEWSVEGGSSGLFLRGKPEVLGNNVRRTIVLGQEIAKPDFEEEWLIFARDVARDGHPAGQVEIAFSVHGDNPGAVQPVATSPLVVYFPTALETHLGFLAQGPYRTTPSRDNVYRHDAWNQQLVVETGTLLIEALEWLRDNDMLTVSTLRCLPLERSRFPEGGMFAPLFDTVRAELKVRDLLPTSDEEYVSARTGRLARTNELRQLITPEQLQMLLASPAETRWLSGDISQDRTPDIRQYLMRELSITEITPEMLISRLTPVFLAAQPDEWLASFYEFLRGQPALVRGGRLDSVPIIRLTNGQHVPVRHNGQLGAFLPGETETSFPTVRAAVCQRPEARAFLEELGLTKPDPVDDVVWHVLPRYRTETAAISAGQYAADIRRIRAAFETDSKTQRKKLVDTLRESPFVMAYDAGTHAKKRSKPADLYLSSAKRLRELFDGVVGVWLVDDDYDCLRGVEMRELLEACGASRSLQPISTNPGFNAEQRRALRIQGGCEDYSGGEQFSDYSIRGLDKWLSEHPSTDSQTQSRKSLLLWEALAELVERNGAGNFSGSYQWSYHKARSTSFDAKFVRLLNETPWVPNGVHGLLRPSDIPFDELAWPPNPVLLSKIRFKPPVIEMLAKEAGIDPGVLELLKKHGITTEADLRVLLGDDKPSSSPPDPVPSEPRAGVSLDVPVNEPLPDRSNPPIQSAPSPTPGDDAPAPTDTPPHTASAPNGQAATGSHAGSRSSSPRHPSTSHPSAGSGGTTREFISYVTVRPDEDNIDPDGLEHKERMELEEKAISLILAFDPRLQRTAANNRGFDLFEAGPSGDPVKWVEVKAMRAGLDDRPVFLSRAQFDSAWIHGEAYWLYIVEYASTPAKAALLRIQDPAGRGMSFAFDRGWRAIALD